ncbi:MAG: hypothetical protein K0Q50_1667 [Vampirovibrio sp.]|nr:hypothetical protein [Vampirovibrio sp.]
MAELPLRMPRICRITTGALPVGVLILLSVGLAPGQDGRALLSLMGWLGQLLLIFRFAQSYLPISWLWRLLVFIALLGLQRFVPDVIVWAGFTALAAAYFVWRYLTEVYRGGYSGKARSAYLIGVGICCAVTGGLMPEAGWGISLGLAIFSLLHCFLREREEKGLSYHQVSNRLVWQRWAKSWGLCWALPLIAMTGFGASLADWLDVSRFIPPAMLNASTEKGAVGIGYFSSFHAEFAAALQPLASPTGQAQSLTRLGCSASAIRLVLIGLLPIIGILGVGYMLPNRFVYRLLRLEDEALLLYWMCGGMLIVATLGHSDSGTIAGLGGLPIMLGWLASYRWVERRPRLELALRLAASLLLLLLLAGVWFG